MPLRIFIGWDSRHPDVFDVAEFSLRRRASVPVDVRPLKIEELRSAGVFWRERDPLASTEFTYTRFLTPLLAGWSGRALYCDSDFLWLGDVNELFAAAVGPKAVWCVQHDYNPSETIKMESAVQSLYPRKNWSSLMLFDCSHPSVRNLTAESVSSQSGAYLHRLAWVADQDIGSLPGEWNWLEGWDKKPLQGVPKAVHFTRGGPWLRNWRDTDYADLWCAERQALDINGRHPTPLHISGIE